MRGQSRHDGVLFAVTGEQSFVRAALYVKLLHGRVKIHQVDGKAMGHVQVGCGLQQGSTPARSHSAAQVRRRHPGLLTPPRFTAAARIPRRCQGRRTSPPPPRSDNNAGAQTDGGNGERMRLVARRCGRQGPMAAQERERSCLGARGQINARLVLLINSVFTSLSAN
jgi:hypothetical protein